jgi:hypothetical protein
MYYYDPNNDKSNARRWASLAALLYALSIAAAFLFVSFDMGRDELLPGEGLLIDFGTTETGLRDQFLGQIVIKIRSFHNYLRKSI